MREVVLGFGQRIYGIKKGSCYFHNNYLSQNTPGARFELATNGLTVHCSTAELTRNVKYEIVKEWGILGNFFVRKFSYAKGDIFFFNKTVAFIN